MSQPVLPSLTTTGIGSLPFEEAREGAGFVLQADLSVPFWPQLPQRNFLEGMVAQYSEGMPCVRPDHDRSKMVLAADDKYDELQRFYENYLQDDPGLFAISEDFALGFYSFLDEAEGCTWPVVKAQVTGPVTFASSIKDSEGLPLFGDTELRDAAAKLLARKAEWQIKKMRPLADESVLVFLDEPVLAAYGTSAYAGLSEEDVAELEGTIYEAVNNAGGITGIHVCGNSDWGMVGRTGVQVINFDAYQYGQTIALYPEEVSSLYDRGGCIAWGIIPTSQEVHEETADSLAEQLEGHVTNLADKGFDEDLVWERSILTPSCGAGSLKPDDARRVFDLLAELQQLLQG